MNLSGRICAMLRYRPWQYTKYSLRALPCLTQIRLGNLSQRLIGEEYKKGCLKTRQSLHKINVVGADAPAGCTPSSARRFAAFCVFRRVDLGTEMNTPMNSSALYALVNNRLVNGKKTIISTNLSDEELNRRYMPQITSRILGEFQCLPFVGTDIRRLRNGQ